MTAFVAGPELRARFARDSIARAFAFAAFAAAPVFAATAVGPGPGSDALSMLTNPPRSTKQQPCVDPRL